MSSTNAAEILFGRKKVESFITAFKEVDTDQDGRVSAIEIGNMLRSQGLAPTQKQVAQYLDELQKEGGSFVLQRFLDICVSCGRNDTRATDLLDFFSPFDPQGTGKVSVKVFRNLMENVGEVFRRTEVDEIIKDFAKGDDIDYRSMLYT